ncbi:MAG: hypothetical protein WCW66_02770 [Patescibacteria group bacterium]
MQKNTTLSIIKIVAWSLTILSLIANIISSIVVFLYVGDLDGLVVPFILLPMGVVLAVKSINGIKKSPQKKDLGIVMFRTIIILNTLSILFSFSLIKEGLEEKNKHDSYEITKLINNH